MSCLSEEWAAAEFSGQQGSRLARVWAKGVVSQSSRQPGAVLPTHPEIADLVGQGSAMAADRDCCLISRAGHRI